MPSSGKKDLSSYNTRKSDVTKLSVMEAAFKAANSFTGSFKLPTSPAPQPARRTSAPRPYGYTPMPSRTPSANTPGAHPANPAEPQAAKPPEVPADSELHLRRKSY